MLKRRNVIQNAAIGKGITYKQEIQNLIDNSGQQLGPGDQSGPRMIDQPEIPVEPKPVVDPLDDLPDLTHSLVLSIQSLSKTAELLSNVSALNAATNISSTEILRLSTTLSNGADSLIEDNDGLQDESIDLLEVSLGTLQTLLEGTAQFIEDHTSGDGSILQQFVISSKSFLEVSQSEELPRSAKSLAICCQLLVQGTEDLPNESRLSIEDRDNEIQLALSLSLSAQKFSIFSVF